MTTCEQTLLQLLRFSLGNANAKPTIPIPDEEWHSVFALAEQHHILPIILDAAYSIKAQIPEAVYALYKRRAAQIISIQIQKTAAFFDLYRFLQEKGLQPLIMKGLICRQLYPVPDYRFSADEDLLIPGSQIRTYHHALVGYGLAADRSEEEVLSSFETGYTSANRLLYIEVHRSPFPSDSDAYGVYNRFFEDALRDAVAVMIDGQGFKTLCPTDHLMYLVCHALKHFLHGGFGIRKVCDICLFGQRDDSEIDWEKLLLQLKEIKGDRFTAALFVIGEEYLGIPAPHSAEVQRLTARTDPTELLADILASGVYGSSTLSRKHSSGITLMAMEKDGTSHENTQRSCFTILFPPRASLQRRYAYVKKHPVLLPIAWGQRIFAYLGARNKTDNSITDTLRLGKKRVAILQQYGLVDRPGASLSPDQTENDAPTQKIVDTDTYLSSMLDLIREGNEVSIPVIGSSMTPFLGDGRDRVFLQKHEGVLKRGDIVLYQRTNGDYVLHRICRIHRVDDTEVFDVIGDAQTRIEKEIKKEQIFAKVTRIERKGKIQGPGTFLWWFFQYIWVDIIPLRHLMIRIYSAIH
ncbi:MAG: nucleotidyltransferase family protein [Eubacterium sp.]|nr:nucleotidyltransferase family protein [Eubacterium sp.]